MANFDIIVKAVDQTRGTFSKIEASMASIQGLATKIGGAIAGAFATDKILEAAKAYQTLETRITAYTGAGAAAKTQFDQLTLLANKLGVSVEDLGLAFGNLKSTGLDSSSASLSTYAKLAAATGSTVEHITDAIGNAYQGQFGKIGKATNDLIDVQEKYGQYVIKIGGIEQARVGSTGQVVDAIKRYVNENKNYADALEKQSVSIQASFNRLNNSTQSAFKQSGLDASLGGLIQKLVDLETNSGAITKSFQGIANAVDFVTRNFETLKTILEIIGVIATASLIGKLGAAVYNVAKGMASIGTAATSAAGSMGIIDMIVATTSNSFKFMADILLKSNGIIEAAIAILAVFGSYFFKLGSIALRFLGGPWGALILGVLTFKDEIIDAGRRLLEFFGILDSRESKPTSGNLSSRYNFPDTAGAGRGRVNPPLVTPEENKGIDQLTEYIKGLSMGLAQARREAGALAPLLNNKDINLASLAYSELSSRLEKFGEVAVKPARLIQRDYAFEVAKTTEQLRQQEIQLANDAVTQNKWKNELQATSLQIYEQSLKLADSAYMTKKWNLEIAQTNIGLMENAQKLKNSQLQQDLFSQGIIAARQGVEQQKISLDLYNKSLSDGTITLKEYATGLSQLDVTLLSVGDRQKVLNYEYSKSQTELGIQKQLLDALTKSYNDGTIGIEDYVKQLNMLNYEYENLSSYQAKAQFDGNKNVRTQDLATQAARNLTQQLRDGTISWRQYDEAIKRLDSEGVARSFINIQNEIFKAKTMGELLAETLSASAKKAGDALAQNLTDGIMKGKISLSSFKDFFGSILNDIAQMVIKKQFVQPIVDALTGSLSGGGMAGGGLLGGILGKMFGGQGGSGSFDFGGLFGGIGDALGGIGDFLGGFLPFADGGIVTGPTRGLIGESGTEAVIPLSQLDNYSNMAHGQQPNVNFTINAIDTQTGVEFLLKNKPQIVGMIQQSFNSQGKRGIYS